MSGVYIAEFEKPSECGHHIDKYVPVMTCPFAKKNGACRLLRSGVHKRDGKRLSFREQYDRCPLAEVPDHGRLIDADALFAEIEGMDIIGTMDNENDAAVSHDAVLCFIDKATTVIPADNGEKACNRREDKEK